MNACTRLACNLVFAAFAGAAGAQPELQFDALPEGRWTGPITSKTVPDLDKDGEWQAEVALSHCDGKVKLLFRTDDGSYSEGNDLVVLPFRRMFLLVFLATEREDLGGWVESQVWTLVDARPKGWTLGQSRAVLNQEMRPDAPWFTFRRFAWGSVEHDPLWCQQRPAPHPEAPAAPEAEPEPDEPEPDGPEPDAPVATSRGPGTLPPRAAHGGRLS